MQEMGTNIKFARKTEIYEKDGIQTRGIENSCSLLGITFTLEYDITDTDTFCYTTYLCCIDGDLEEAKG